MFKKLASIITAILMTVAFCAAGVLAQEPVATTFSYGAKWGPEGKPELVKLLERNYRLQGNRINSTFFEDYGMSGDWNPATQTPGNITNVFSSGARKIYCWNSVSQVAAGSAVTFNWYDPMGAMVQSSTETIDWSGYGWVTGSLDLQAAARMLGRESGKGEGDVDAERVNPDMSGVWRVDVVSDGATVHTQNFAVDAMLPIMQKPRIGRGGFLGSQSAVRSSGVLSIGASTLASQTLQGVFARAQVSVEDMNGATVWIPIGNLARTGERTAQTGDTEADHEINIPVGVVPQGRLDADLIKVITRDSDGNNGVWPNFEIQ